MTSRQRQHHGVNFSARSSAGAAAAGALAATTEASAQGAAPLKIVDFHNHYMGPSWTLTNLANVPPAARADMGKDQQQSPEPERADRRQSKAQGSPRG